MIGLLLLRDDQRMYILVYMKKYSVAEARAHLPMLLREVEHGAVEITRKGEPTAVVLSTAEFERLKGGRPSFREAYRAWQRTVVLARIGVTPEETLSLRDRSEGRAVRLR
jgi:prevent-host-death family protein